jgi:hypothetical protein
MYLLPDSASYNDVNPFPAYCKSIQGSYLDLSFSDLFFTRIYYGFAIVRNGWQKCQPFLRQCSIRIREAPLDFVLHSS